MGRRLKILEYYAGYLTALVTFTLYVFLAVKFTHMDVLEIIVTYAVFLYLPSVYLPFIIIGEGKDNDAM